MPGNWWDQDQVVQPSAPTGFPAGAVPIGAPDPTYAYKGPAAAVDLALAQSKVAAAPFEARKAAAEAKLAEAKAARGADVDNSGSAAVRADALKQYRAAVALGPQIDDLEGLFNSGPGATSGISGLEDYLPTVANNRVNAASDRLRGSVLNAYGFTSGQSNTPGEVRQNIGGYLPASGDYDTVSRDKIAALRALQKNALDKAVSILGGEPDDNGNIHPVKHGIVGASAPVSPPGSTPPPPSGPPPAGGMDRSSVPVIDPGSGGSGLSLAAGKTRIENNPARAGVNDHVNSMMKQGKSDDEVKAYLAGIGAPGAADAALAFRAQNPAYRGSYTVDLERHTVPMSMPQQLFNAVGSSPVGSYAIGAGDALTAGTLDNMTANPALSRAVMAGSREQNPRAAFLGEVTGGVIGSGAMELGLGAAGARLGTGLGARFLGSARTADGLYGAATGSGNADDGNRLGGALLGATVGTGGGMAGRTAIRGAGNLTRGVRDGAVDYLRAQGVPLTVGQTLSRSGRLGAAVKGVEDRLAGFPLVGDIVNGRRLEGMEAFNRSAFDQALSPIGATTGGVVQEPGVDLARRARSDAYSAALDPVRVAQDAPYLADMTATRAAGRSLPEPMRGNLDYTLPTRVDNSFAPSGVLTGRDFQQSIRGLRRDAKAVANLPYGYDFGQVTRQAEDALGGLLDRQAPGAVPAYQAANAANRNVEIVRDAVNRARSGTRVGEPGLFAPSQLSDAASANSKVFGGTQGTTQQPFFDLTRAGQRVLPSSVPDSGTAGRAALGLGLGALGLGGGGAGVGYAAGDTESGAGAGLGLGALLALGGTRSGQRALTSILTRRPDIAIRLGDQINRRSALGGMFGAGFAPVLLPSN